MNESQTIKKNLFEIVNFFKKIKNGCKIDQPSKNFIVKLNKCLQYLYDFIYL